MNTPVLFLIFNRPDTTNQIFNAIKQVKPKHLYIAADGPRVDKEGEAELCKQTRSIINNIDWDCEVKTLFREENLGCKNAVSSAIDWFFDNVEEGIILEDDTLPNESFFIYCEKMLEKYRYDTRIMHISGENPLYKKMGENSYYFSSIPHIWGWATWKRAWNLYDVEMKFLDNFIKKDKIKDIFDKEIVQKYWLDRFLMVKNGEINTWDYQWTYTILSSNGLCINSNKNFISNIGFREDATHLQITESPFSNKTRQNIDLELKHPEFIVVDKKALNEILEFRFEIKEKKKVPFHKKIKREILRPLKRTQREK